MLQLLIVVGRALALGLRGHRELVLENLALRQQLMAMKRANRPRLNVAIDCFGSPWRRVWTELAHGVGGCPAGHRRAVASRLAPPPMDPAFESPTGRPSTSDQQIRVLVRDMATANRCGAHHEFMASSARSVSTSRNARCRVCWTVPTSIFSNVEDLPDESPSCLHGQFALSRASCRTPTDNSLSLRVEVDESATDDSAPAPSGVYWPSQS